MCLATVLTLLAQDTPVRQPLTLADIVRQVEGGISEDLVATSVKKTGRAYNLNEEEINELKRKGLSDALIKVLIDPSLPYERPAPPPAPVAGPAPPPAPRKPTNPIAEKVPPEPGMYLASADEQEFTKLPLRTLTAAKASRTASILTGGLKKPPVIGYLAGAQASTKVPTASPVFYLRLPEKVAIEEVLLLALAAKQDRREIELGSDPGKPIFPPGAVRQFESKEIDPGLFRISLVTLDPGEYIFYMLGSADEKKGIVGKGYEFTY